jgi:hypothetical protein
VELDEHPLAQGIAEAGRGGCADLEDVPSARMAQGQRGVVEQRGQAGGQVRPVQVDGKGSAESDSGSIVGRTTSNPAGAREIAAGPQGRRLVANRR